MKTIKEMKARLRAINEEAKKVATGDTEALNKLLTEAREIEAKIAEAEDRAHLQHLADNASEGGEQNNGEGGQGADDSATKRGKALMAGGKVKRKASFGAKNTLTSSSTVMTQHTASDLNPGFNEVSSLVDRVKVVPLVGGESYKRGFVKGYGTGGYTAEAGNYTDAEPVFGYAEMAKTKITAYCEEPEEMQKLPAADYDGVVSGSTEIAVRKKMNRDIMIGDGSAGHLVGIFHNPTSASDDIIDRETDIPVVEIDENTLDEIIYGYGGDEDVSDVAVLILCKADLKAFATARKQNGDKAYKVVNRGNTGTIDEVQFIINSACSAISNAETEEDEYCMAYGHLSHYELAVFSDMDIQRSTEFKFKQGQIANRADIFVGGNVAAHNGFVRVKKAVAPAPVVTTDNK